MGVQSSDMSLGIVNTSSNHFLLYNFYKRILSQGCVIFRDRFELGYVDT